MFCAHWKGAVVTSSNENMATMALVPAVHRGVFVVEGVGRHLRNTAGNTVLLLCVSTCWVTLQTKGNKNSNYYPPMQFWNSYTWVDKVTGFLSILAGGCAAFLLLLLCFLFTLLDLIVWLKRTWKSQQVQLEQNKSSYLGPRHFLEYLAMEKELNFSLFFKE